MMWDAKTNITTVSKKSTGTYSDTTEKNTIDTGKYKIIKSQVERKMMNNIPFLNGKAFIIHQKSPNNIIDFQLIN